MATSNDDPKMADKAKLLRDLAPSVETQSMGFVNWNETGNILGQPFDNTKIPLTKLRQMSRDPMIAFGLQFVKLPLIRAPWYIDCEDPRICAFVTECLKLIYERLMMQVSLKYTYGYQAIVKNFTTAKVDWTYTDATDSANPQTLPVWTAAADPVIWKPFTSIPPESVTPEFTPEGEFDGFYYAPSATMPGVRQKDPNLKNDGKIDIQHALWVTNEKDSKHGSIWGYPRIGYAYRYWWSYWYGWALRDRYMERASDPSVIVRFPNERINDESGQPINTRAIAEGLGQNVRAGQTVSLPNKLIQDGEGKMTGTPEWDIHYLEHASSPAAEFQQLFDYLDVMKLRSILVPEQALIQGAGAQSSRNVAEQLADFFTESQATEMVEFGDLVNRYMIPQLVAANFPEYKGQVRWISRGFSSTDQALILQLLTLIGQADPNSLEVDTREIMQQLQVPIKSPEQLAQEKTQEEADQQKQLDMQLQQQMELATHAASVAPTPASASSSSTPTPAKTSASATTQKTADGGNAAKPKGGQRGPQNTDWQKYQFSDVELSAYPIGPFATKVKDLRYFKGDDEALQAAHELYDIWSDAYTDYYAMIAEYFSTIELAEQDNNESFVGHLVRKTIEKALKIFNKALAKSIPFYQKLAASAAKKEMKELHFDIDWQMDNQDIQSWMRDHGAQLVRHVTDSTRKEVSTFISKELATDKTPLEISKAIEDEFAQWPGWKAERLARSEARDAYNAGTLLAAQQNGITHVQASDASGGRNTHTDQMCIDRNGKIFTIPQAMMEVEHPNGTLVWRPIPAGLTLSIERHSLVNGSLASFNEEDGVIHLADELTAEQESDFLMAVVDQLRAKP